MKKYSIFLLGALALAAVSCDEAPDFDAPLQSNPQGPVYTAGNIAIEVVGPIATGTLDLNAYSPEGSIEVVKVVKADSLPTGAEVYYKFEVANNPEFNGEKVLDVKVVDGAGSISVATLNDDHISMFGKSPKPKTVYYRVPVYVKVNGSDFRWGGTDFYASEGSYQETCIDAGFTISSAYYFVGDINEWSLANPDKFNHSAADVYDDPVFSIILTFGDNSYWKIASQEAVDLYAEGEKTGDDAIKDSAWGILYGPEEDGDSSLTGTLHEGGQAGKVAEAGTYKVTINMETMEYTFERFTRPVYLCTPGGGNGWNQSASQWLNYAENKGYFCGAVVEADGFKMTDGDTWADDKTWGMGAEEGTLVQPGGNIPVPEAGLYWVTANVEDLTYTNTLITSVGVVGGLNGWNQTEPVELVQSEDHKVWSADVNLTGEWKIVINHSWDSNYGGTIADPVFDNPNNFSGYEGTYNVAVDFSGNYPKIVLTQK